ncbi:MAG TPA: PilZ domain-containing protein [Kofleriaceae bacterium]
MSRSEREHTRYAHEAAVTFRFNGRTYEGRTRNVSRGGLCATIVEMLPMGTELELDMVLVFDDDLQSDALRLPARVVWCTHVDEANQIGVSFKPFDARRAEQLDLFLSFLDDRRTEKTAHDIPIDERFG